MIQYMQAEHLTSKRTFIRKLIILIPLLNTAFSFLLNAAYFMTGTFNWWAVIFMPLMIALMCGLSVKKEKKSANDRAVYSLPADLKSIWLSKISLIALYSLLSQIVFFIIMFLLGLVFPGIAALQLKGVEAGSLLWLTTLWEIPLCLWIARQFGFTAVILANMIAAFVLGIVPASGSLWWLSPWSWSVRVMSPILGIHPNGIPLPADSGLLNGNVIFPAIILSILSFIAISLISAVSFSKGETGHDRAFTIYVGRCIKNEAHAAHMDACCGAGFMRGIFPIIYVWKGSGALYAVQRLFQRDCRFIPSNHQYCLRHVCLCRGTGGAIFR